MKKGGLTLYRKKPAEKSVTVQRIRATAVLAVWWFLCGAAAVFSLTAAAVLAVLSLAVYFYFILFYFQKWYDNYRFTISKDRIYIEKGVIFSKRISVFRSRVQYAQLVQTPLQKLFHTCTVVYQTAGAAVYLSEISETNADGAMFNEKKKTK